MGGGAHSGGGVKGSGGGDIRGEESNGVGGGVTQIWRKTRETCERSQRSPLNIVSVILLREPQKQDGNQVIEFDFYVNKMWRSDRKHEEFSQAAQTRLSGFVWLVWRAKRSAGSISISFSIQAN